MKEYRCILQKIENVKKLSAKADGFFIPATSAFNVQDVLNAAAQPYPPGCINTKRLTTS